MSGYAVLDVQTTGLEPSMHHRIVEIAIIDVADDGTRGSGWWTLVNPQRDVGETGLHGISARDVLSAPTFDELVPRVLGSLRGRTLVAHNPAFELSFLDAELRRCGVPLTTPISVGVPTMEWFGLISPRRRRRLVDCCDEVGIELDHRYSSEHQSAAVAELLRRYIEEAGGEPPWADVLAWAEAYQWPELTSAEPLCELRCRADVGPGVPGSWLDRIISRMPTGGEPRVDEYLDVLEMALLDRYLSEHEIQSLVLLAERLGLERAEVLELHQDYLTAMAKVAWEDGIVTEAERQDLGEVAQLLGLPDGAVDGALLAAESGSSTSSQREAFVLKAGDSVCLTGTMSTARDLLEAEARFHGLNVGGLTKSTRLLVAADPDSLSGKAKKARQYDVVIVDESGFRSLLPTIRD